MRSSGAASIQPKPKEQAELTSIIAAITAVRPQRSDSAPPTAEATMPMTWNRAESEAPRPAARSGAVPVAGRGRRDEGRRPRPHAEELPRVEDVPHDHELGGTVAREAGVEAEPLGRARAPRARALTSEKRERQEEAEQGTQRQHAQARAPSRPLHHDAADHERDHVAHGGSGEEPAHRPPPARRLEALREQHDARRVDARDGDR